MAPITLYLVMLEEDDGRFFTNTIRHIFMDYQSALDCAAYDQDSYYIKEYNIDDVEYEYKYALIKERMHGPFSSIEVPIAFFSSRKTAEAFADEYDCLVMPIVSSR